MDKSDTILKLEHLIGLNLPTDYRDWLIQPSSIPLPSEIAVPDNPPWIGEVTNLYTVDKVYSTAFFEKELHAQGYRDFPANILVIGDDDNGDYILLSLRTSDFGSIYYLFHETADPEAQDDWAGIFILAASFSEWTSTLRKTPADPSIPN